MTATDRTKLLSLLRERLPEGWAAEEVGARGDRYVRVHAGRQPSIVAERVRVWWWSGVNGNRSSGPYTGRGWRARMADDIAAAVRELTGGEAPDLTHTPPHAGEEG